MREPWHDFLADGTAPGHGVEIYMNDAELVDSVASFLAAGFDADAAGVVVATPEHTEAILAEIAKRGYADRPYLVAGADEVLASLYEDGDLSAAAFDREIGALLDEAASTATGPPRVFGEMVDLLCMRNAQRDAIALEELWEELRRRRPFSLLCGYELDVFDVATQKAPMPEICNAHSHVLPAHDLERFNDAVARALTDVLGPATTRDIFYIVDRPLRARRVPAAQDALRWLVASFPAEAGPVLEAARGYYAGVEAA
jgi:hypothetical protein